MRFPPASFSLLAAGTRPACRHHTVHRALRARWLRSSSTRSFGCPRRSAGFHRKRRRCMPHASQHEARRCRNATKPRKLPYAASVSTSIRSAHVLADLRRPLRRRTSIAAVRSSDGRLSSRVTVSAPPSYSSLARRRCLRRVRIIQAVGFRCKRVGALWAACPQESFVVHGDSLQFALFTVPLGAVVAGGGRTMVRRGRSRRASCALVARRSGALAHPGLRTSATPRRTIVRPPPGDDLGAAQTLFEFSPQIISCRNATKPSKLPYTVSISMRIDLRLPSPTFIGQGGVELRIGVSFKISLCFRFASSHFRAGELLTARPSSLPPTCSHHTRVVGFCARARARRWPVVHKKVWLCTSTHINPRNAQLGKAVATVGRDKAVRFPGRLCMRENRYARVRPSHRRPRWRRTSQASLPRASRRSPVFVSSDVLESIVRPRLQSKGCYPPFLRAALSARLAARSQAPRYAATTSRCVASSAPVPVRTIRPRSMT